MADVRRQVAEHDKKQLETLVPLLEKHVSRAPKALSACLQLQDTAAKWYVHQPSLDRTPAQQQQYLNILQNPYFK